MFAPNEKAYISQSSLDAVELDSSFDLETIPTLANSGIPPMMKTSQVEIRNEPGSSCSGPEPAIPAHVSDHGKCQYPSIA